MVIRLYILPDWMSKGAELTVAPVLSRMVRPMLVPEGGCEVRFPGRITSRLTGGDVDGPGEGVAGLRAKIFECGSRGLVTRENAANMWSGGSVEQSEWIK